MIPIERTWYQDKLIKKILCLNLCFQTHKFNAILSCSVVFFYQSKFIKSCTIFFLWVLLQESIANSTTSFLNVFYNVPLNKKMQIVPSVQLAYEYSGGEKYQGVRTGEHVMNNLMSGIGLDLFVNNITLNMALQTKAWSAKDDHAQPSGRVVLGITYNFNQLYYLLN